MATATVDIIDGARGTETAQGLRLFRKAIVTGLTGPAARRIVTALDPTSRIGVPALGSLHPYAPILCIEREAQALDSGTVEINLTYGVPDSAGGGGSLPPEIGEPPQLTVGATLQSVQTNFDHNRNKIEVVYTPPLAPGEVGPPAPIKSVVTVDMQVPHVTIDFLRREDSTPLAKAQKYVGRINSVAVQAFPQKTLLCSAIVGSTRDGGVTYDVRYEFQATDLDAVVKTWDATVVYVDPETNRPPDDVGNPTIANPIVNGARLVQLYPLADFNALELFLPSTKKPSGRYTKP